MTDLRQGVTATQQAVLDLIEREAPGWADSYDFEEQLKQAMLVAGTACRSNKLTAKRTAAIEAAARLIDAADEISRMLQLDGNS